MSWIYYVDYHPVTIAFFIILSAVSVPLTYYLVINNWFHIKRYRSLIITSIIMIPAVTVGSIGFILETILYFLDMGPFFPFGFVELIAHIGMGVLIAFTTTMLIFFGKNWMMRRRHFFHNDYGPYLIPTSDPAHEMKICGHASRKILKSLKMTADTSRLFYRQKSSNNFSVKPLQFRPRGFWSVKLTDLKPETEYEYAVPLLEIQNEKQSESKSATYRWSFKTFKIEGKRCDSLDFIYLSDMHAGGRDIGWIVDLIKKKYSEISFIVSSGDCVSDSRNFTHWKTLFNQLRPISGNYPFIHSIGNHDGLIPKMANRWKSVLPYELPEPDSGIYYKVCYGNVCFLILDNYNSGNDYPLLSEQQIRWAERTLKGLPDSITIKYLVMHEPFYSTSTTGFRKDLEQNVMPIIEKYDIAGVLTGHVHYFELFHRRDIGPDQGTTFIIAGGAGGRVEHAIFRQLNNPPYLWTGPIHNARQEFFKDGDTTSELRNDEYVKKYQKYAFSEKHFIYIKIRGKKITYNVIGKDGSILFEYTQI